MISITIFAFSGGAIILLVATKRQAIKGGDPGLILKLISRGDNFVRSFRHHTVRKYADWTDGSEIRILRKRASMQTQNYINKTLNYTKSKIEEYIGDIRNSRLLKKKPDGLSEYFKNMKSVEKGNGHISESYDEKSFQGDEKSVR